MNAVTPLLEVKWYLLSNHPACTIRKAIQQLPWARTIWFLLAAKLLLDFENNLPGCAVMGNLIVSVILKPRTNLVHCHSWLQWYRSMRGWIQSAPRLHQSHHDCDCVVVQLPHTSFKHQPSKAHPCSSAWQEGRLAQSEKICCFFLRMLCVCKILGSWFACKIRTHFWTANGRLNFHYRWLLWDICESGFWIQSPVLLSSNFKSLHSETSHMRFLDLLENFLPWTSRQNT